MRLTLFFAAALLACTPPAPPCPETAPLPHPSGALISAQLQGGRLIIEGRPGAAAPGEAVRVDGEPHAADEAGAFRVEFDTSRTVEVVTENGTFNVRARDDDASGCALGEPLRTGTLPNDVALTFCDGRAVAAVPTGADNAVQIFDGDLSRAVAFDEVGSQPFHLATAGARAVVSLFGTDQLALLDLCAGTLLDVSQPTLILEVTPPAEVDGQIVSQTLPRRPQGVALLGDEAFIAYTGLLQVGPDPIFGPAYLARFGIEGDRLVERGGLTLPCNNPQSLSANEGALWVSCSGTLARVDGRFSALDDGALLEVDPLSMEVVHRVELERFAPGTVSFSAETLVVGSLLRASVALLPRDAARLSDGRLVRIGPDEVTDSIFEVLVLPGEIGLAAVFGQDELRAIDLRDGALDPLPFAHPLLLSDGGPLRGAIALVGGLGPDDRLRGFALLGLSNELVPLDFQQLVGP